MNSLYLVVLTATVFLVFTYQESFGSNQIFISISSDRDAIIYDGKWTSTEEWERTSLDTIPYDDGKTVILRTAHQGNFLYVFVDAVEDFTLDYDNDNAVICIDGNNDKKTIDKNDFCFTATLGKGNGTILQGQNNSSLQVIQNHADFIGKSSASDQNDRYTAKPHPSYEFRIPIELFGRSDKYGFFFSMYDSSAKKFYNWPTNATRNNVDIPSPQLWGELISPDKSLPEFDLPLLVLLPSLVLVFYFTRTKSKQ
ncbi:MAG: hypothetical protein QXN55_06225 [Candidatus Nitrosotenuis sp.]|jgi:hypothetical protein